ncbi:MAG: TolC family protein [Balneolaceae bacterium]
MIAENSAAQDTLRISLDEFINRGIQNSGQMAFEQGAVDLARNRTDQARAQRILPRFDLSSQHGVVPGVKSDSTLPSGNPLPQGQFYLDPNLRNDWDDWAIFTRAEVTMLQPIYTWGAISNAIDAAKAGASAAQFEFEAKQAGAEVQLFELYYSYLLSLEVSRLLDDANRQIDQVGERLQELIDEGDPDIKEADLFKFDIFKEEFQVQRAEVEQGRQFVERIWRRALQAAPGEYFMPREQFLDPIPIQIEEFEIYENYALNGRPELRGVESGIQAMQKSVQASRAQYLPSLFLGLNARFAHTPNRPRQDNPFIINSTNFSTLAVGLTIRQNLNFFTQRQSVERVQIEYRRTEDLRHAISDGVLIELSDAYREAVIADSKVLQTERALNVTKEWVRHEQLNYDFGFGDVNDLTDAIQKELELELELKQNIFERNKRLAELYKAAGIPVTQLYRPGNR